MRELKIKTVEKRKGNTRQDHSKSSLEGKSPSLEKRGDVRKQERMGGGTGKRESLQALCNEEQKGLGGKNF